MALPDATIRISDGALGFIAPNEKASAKVGACAAGTVNTVYSFTDTKTLVDTLVSGPAVEAAAHTLAVSGGTVYVVPCATSAGSNGAVSLVGTGLSVLSLTGTPLDAYQLKVKIVVGGANPAAGTVTLQVSLDGGDNYADTVALPTSGIYAVTGTGLTLNFSAASLVAGDVYSATCVAPSFNTTQLGSALDALLADPRTWKFVHVVGEAVDATGAAAVAAAVQVKMAAAETAYRFAYAMVECPDVADNLLITAFAAVSANRVSVGAGHCELVSALTGRIHKRPIQWTHAARRHGAAIHEDSGRVLSGALLGVTSLHRNEAVTPGLDAVRFVTARTIVGLPGFYLTNGNTMAPVGSDFDLCQYREVMDRACTVARAGMAKYINEAVRVNAANVQAPLVAGAIDERDARAIESDVGGKLAAALLAPGSASSLSIQVNRTDNILSTRVIRTKVRIVPLGYAKTLETDLGFTNPALALN